MKNLFKMSLIPFFKNQYIVNKYHRLQFQCNKIKFHSVSLLVVMLKKFPADLDTFTEEILNGKRFLCIGVLLRKIS